MGNFKYNYCAGQDCYLVYSITDNRNGATGYLTTYNGKPVIKAEDMDYIGFTFNGKHSYYDLNILRVIEGDRYQDSLFPQSTDKTADIPGGDGMYYFDTKYNSKQFIIKIAFDSLTEKQLRELRTTFSGKEICDLIFDEAPYKVYSAKVTGTPSISYIPFDQNGKRVYKGEGTIQLTAYWPYAHTPDGSTKISRALSNNGSGFFGGDGRMLSSYSEWFYPTKTSWSEASGLASVDLSSGYWNYNPGEVGADFILTVSAKPSMEKIESIIFYVDNNAITALEKPGAITALEWDSKTGIVTRNKNATNKNSIINCSGNVCGKIRPLPYSVASNGFQLQIEITVAGHEGPLYWDSDWGEGTGPNEWSTCDTGLVPPKISSGLPDLTVDLSYHFWYY